MTFRKSKTIIVAVLLAIGFSVGVNGQKIAYPNFSLKTPKTIEIIEVELTGAATIVRGSIENQIEDGYFCLDRKTYIFTANGARYNLEDSKGLPFCPETFKFNSIGEKVYFSLTFPALPPGIGWFDLIEECGDMCLSMYGITLDSEVNSALNKGFRALDSGENNEAVNIFESLLNELKKTDHALLGSVYVNLVTLYDEEGMSSKLDKILKEISSGSFPRKSLFTANLRSLGYSF